MNCKLVLAVLSGFCVGCTLCFFFDPHKIHFFESRQTVLSDVENSAIVTQSVAERITGLIDHCKDQIQKDSTLAPEMRGALADDDFWNRLKSEKKDEVAEIDRFFHADHLELLEDLSLRELIDLREFYRTPVPVHLQKNLSQRGALKTKRNRKGVEELISLAQQYYWERHPEPVTKSKVIK